MPDRGQGLTGINLRRSSQSRGSQHQVRDKVTNEPHYRFERCLLHRIPKEITQPFNRVLDLKDIRVRCAAILLRGDELIAPGKADLGHRLVR